MLLRDTRLEGRVERAEAWARTHRAAVDAACAAAAALVVAVVLAPSVPEASLLALVQVGALAWRRTRPVLSAALVLGATAVHWALGVLAGVGGLLLLPSDAAVLVAVYSVAAHGPRWARWTGLLAGLLGAVLLGATVASGSLDSVVSALAVLLAVTGVAAVVVLLSWTAGQWRRTRLEHLAALEDRARSAETEREQALALAAAAERARIAREMHDVVAHSLSVVIAQADGGRYAAAADPAAAARALETVAATGRAALRDMRRLLGVLREDDGAAATAPQPGTADVPDLVASVRASGLPVALVTTGEARPLPPGASLAVYRVVQESLTNVLKHGGPSARAQVRLHWEPARLVVCVEDDGRGASAGGDGAGAGLAGMGERMALYGGTAAAGPRAGGGFAVRAELPLPGAAPAAPTTAAAPATSSAPVGPPPGTTPAPTRG